MILTDYYHGEKLTDAKCRFDITSSTGEYDMLEGILINKRGFNVGGLSINLVDRPDRWESKNATQALTKGSINITSLIRPNINCSYSFGDIQGTRDALIVKFNNDWKSIGITTIDIFIARGLKNDVNGLWDLLMDGELNHEMDMLRDKAVTKIVTRDE